MNYKFVKSCGLRIKRIIQVYEDQTHYDLRYVRIEPPEIILFNKLAI